MAGGRRHLLGWCSAVGWTAANATSTCGSSGLEALGRRRAPRRAWARGLRADCGWTLARAHARSGDRFAIAAYLGHGEGFDRAVCSFASEYAEQNLRDHQALLDAIDSGRVRRRKTPEPFRYPVVRRR